MNTLWSAAEGFASGSALANMKRIEDSVRQGQNHYLTGVLQAGQIWENLEQIQHLLKATGCDPLSLPFRCIIVIPPLLLAYAVAQQFGGPDLYLIYDHIGTVCQIASLVTSVTLIIFGSTAYGVASITLIGIGFLDRNGIFSPEVRSVIHMTTYPIFLVTGLLVGGPFTQLLVAANLVTMAANAFWGAPAVPETIPPQRVATDLDQLILTQYQNLTPDPLHLRYNTVPPVPNVNIGELNTLCAAIDWNEGSNQRALNAKLARDPRFRDRFQGRVAPDVYMRDQLRALVHSVQNRTILAGEPVNYTDMHNYLKIITAHLPRLDERSRADILLKLAIDGGEYCGPGKFNTVSDAFLSVLSAAATPLPLETKVLTHLQLQRIRIFQNLYNQIAEASPINRAAAGLVDNLDLHAYNMSVNLFGREFGLPNQGAAEDTAAHVDPVMLAAVSRLGLREHFFRTYNTNFIVQSLQEAIGTPSLPLPIIYEWWQGWIERLNVSEAEKARLREELPLGELNGQSMEVEHIRVVEDRPIRRRTLAGPFVKTMLVEMGILKIPLSP